MEADVGGLRRAVDHLTQVRSDLELQVEVLMEELVLLQKVHQQVNAGDQRAHIKAQIKG